MPHQTPLRAGDPRRVGRYRLTGRLAGIPSDDPIFIGTGPDGTAVAISMLRGGWAHDPAARDRFAAEAAVAKRVPPFCAARVLDAGVDGPDAYLVSEYVPGQSLLELIAAEGVQQGHDLDAIAIGMATGLASVHQAGLVHGSFGPDYVIMANDGPPRVIEFGITPPYGAATPSADMLAWAQTVAFAASGHPPTSMADLDVLPDHIREPVLQCLGPDPSERPAARAVVLSLLGDAQLPAGVLAEGSRRAVRAATRAASPELVHGGRHSVGGGAGSRPVSPRPGSARPAGPGQQLARRQGRPPVRSRHSQGGAAGTGRRGAGPDRRRTAWIAAGALVVLLLIAAALVRLAQDNGGSGRPSAASQLRHQTSPKPGRSTVSPSSGPVLPAAFAGAWSGQVKQISTYTVKVTLAAGAPSGTVTYSGVGLNCSGVLNLTQASGTKLTMSQGITQGQCKDGRVTITRTSSETVWFSFTNGGISASGSLTKS